MTPGMQDYQRLRQWLEQQERRIAEIEAENRELKRQLQELRRGVGISVLIQGKAIPLAGEVSPGLFAATDATPHPPAQTVQRAMHPTPPARPAKVAFPEDAWLTGHGPAARPGDQPAKGHSTLMSAHRATPAPVAPEWLRDAPERASRAMPSAHEARASVPRTQMPEYAHTGPVSTQAASEARMRMGSLASHTVPRLESIPRGGLPSLAQLTGSQPVVRPHQEARNRNRSPYSDSFVLD